MAQTGTKVANAIVTVIPSMEGARAAIGTQIPAMVGAAADEAGEEGGKKLGGSLKSGLSTMKVAIGNFLGNLLTGAVTSAADAVKGTLTDTFNNFADFQQLSGGVETLFKDSSETVMENAKKAFETAGMSANEYMETVTGFSASLISSLGGDTAKAASLADKALVDMSDNANKMGTDMERISDAYGGFAKGNFTMLDNLKLGYGGTKTEMERLLEDAEKLKASQGEYVDYSIDSFADVVEAIHAVQDNMGITGTTSREAATTISGALGMAQSSWQDFLTGIANPDADMSKLTENLVGSLKTVFDNVAPTVQNIATGAFNGMLTVLDQVGLGGAANFIRGFVEAFQGPTFHGAISTITDMMAGFVGALSSPQVQGAVNSVMKIFEGLISDITGLFNRFAPSGNQVSGVIETIASAISWLAGVIEAVWPVAFNIIAFVQDVAGTAFGALFDIISELGAAIAEIGGAMLGEMADSFNEFGEVDLSDLAGSLKTVIGFVKDLVINGLSWIKDNAPTIGAVLGTIGSVLFKVFSVVVQVIGGVVEVIGNVIRALTDFFTNDPIGQQITGTISAAFGAIGGFITWLLDTVSGALDGILGFLSSTDEEGRTVWTGFTDAVAGAWNVIVSGISAGLELITANFNAVVDWFQNDPLGQAITRTFGGIVDIIRGAWELISGIFSTALGIIVGLVSGDFTMMANSASSIMDGLARIMSGVWNVITGIFQGAMDSVGKFVSDGFNAIVDFVSKIPERIAGFFKTLPGLLKTQFEAAVRVVGTVFSKLLDEARKIPGKIFNFFREIPGKIAQAFKNIRLPQLRFEGEFDLNPAHFRLPQIKFYKAGGWSDGPELQLKGEAGPELTTPMYQPYLRQYAAAIADEMDISGSGGTTMIVDGAVVNSSEEIERKFYDVMMELRRLGNMNRGYTG